MLALLWSCIKTWSWVRRSGGDNSLDGFALMRLVIYVTNDISAMLLLVCGTTSFYLFIVWREQGGATMFLPTKQQEHITHGCIIAAAICRVS